MLTDSTVTDTSSTWQSVDNLLAGTKYLTDTVLLPVVVAVTIYLLVDRLGEWKRRRAVSRLGVAIVDSLREEVRTGLQIMGETLERAREGHPDGPSPAALPHRSWDGMSTIPDDVLLRIIETSEGREFPHFYPSECRTHCKNYFEHLRANYAVAAQAARNLARQNQAWADDLQASMASGAGADFEAAEGVDRMLETTRQLLLDNSRRRLFTR
jgi:hypothetical protein